jgi:hypothetical protein
MIILMTKVNRMQIFLIIIFVGAIISMAACSKQTKGKDSINVESNKTNDQISEPDKEDESVYSDITTDNPNLPIIIPAEWKDKYTVEEVYATYFNGEEEYIENTVTKKSFFLSPDAKTDYQGAILDITSVPNEEITNYLNWGMKDASFLLGFNDEYYFFSSGSFGVLEQQDSVGDLECFSPEEVKKVLKESFSQNGNRLYWASLVHDADTLHGRNNSLPFEMNIQFLYDIKGSYEFIDESGDLPIEDVINHLLKQYADDLSVFHKNWRFSISRCEMTVYDPLYHKDNKELLSENIDLQDYYMKGDLGEYLEENCWIFVSGCKVYDYKGFISMMSSREFKKLNLDYVGAEAGAWVVEKKDNTYRMFRPDIPFVGQGA